LQLVSSFNLLAMADSTAPKVEIVDATVTAVRVPSQFDEGQRAQIVIEGELPSDCYSVGNITIRSPQEDLDQGIIQFHVNAVRSIRSNCSAAKTSFMKVVELGNLPARTYKILNYKNLRKMAQLEVTKIQ